MRPKRRVVYLKIYHHAIAFLGSTLGYSPSGTRTSAAWAASPILLYLTRKSWVETPLRYGWFAGRAKLSMITGQPSRRKFETSLQGEQPKLAGGICPLTYSTSCFCCTMGTSCPASSDSSTTSMTVPTLPAFHLRPPKGRPDLAVDNAVLQLVVSP